MGMQEKKAAESYAVAIAQQELIEWKRLPPDPVSLLNPINAPALDGETSQDWGLPIQETLVAGFADMGVAITASDISSTASPVRPIKRTKVTENKAVGDISPARRYCWPQAQQSVDSWTRAVSRLSVREDDVAKLTPERVTSTLVLPLRHKVVVVCGDKEGYVGLWDVDAPSSANGRGDPDGIYKYHPHVSSVCNIHCNSNSVADSRVYTCSYDGTIRCLDVDGSRTSSFRLMFETPDDLADVIFSDVAFSPFHDHSVFIGRSDGKVGYKDLRTPVNGGYQWLHQLHECKVNSVQQHPTNPNYFVSASSTKLGYVSVHDIRKLSAKVPSICDLDAHSLSINAAYSSPDGQYLVSVSQDNTVKVWSDWLNLAQLNSSGATNGKLNTSPDHSFKHDNHTGRWLSTFRPVFDPKNCSTFALGSMVQPRRVDLFVISKVDGSVSTIGNQLSSPNLNSVCSRNSFHPFEHIVATGNSSGRVHVFR